jgi:hypothetical protein
VQMGYNLLLLVYMEKLENPHLRNLKKNLPAMMMLSLTRGCCENLLVMENDHMMSWNGEEHRCMRNLLCVLVVATNHHR